MSKYIKRQIISMNLFQQFINIYKKFMKKIKNKISTKKIKHD